MKRIGIILCMLLLLISSSRVYANTNESIVIESLKESHADYSEIVELDEEIKQMINIMREDTNLEGLPDDYTVDYSKVNKIYVDTDIFSLETPKNQDIKKALEEGDYMYLLIVNIENTAYQIHISRGLPLDESLREVLTEEEIKTIQAEEGKWIVSAIEAFEDESIHYEDTISSVLKDIHYESDAEAILCGGLKHIHQPVALVMNHEKVELLIPLYYDLEISGTEEQLGRLRPNAAQDVDGVYLYSKIKDAVNEMEEPDEGSVGAGGYIELPSEEHGVETGYPIVIVIVLVGVAATVIYGIRKKNKKN